MTKFNLGDCLQGKGFYTKNIFIGIYIGDTVWGNTKIRLTRNQNGCPAGSVVFITDTVLVARTDELYWRTDMSNTQWSETPRAALLDEAKTLIHGDRNASYGEPTQNFQDTADVWTVLFTHKLKDGEHFTAADIAAAMVALKLVRRKADDKRDNWLDMAGYSACGWECVAAEGESND